jgi:hypothetical protein
MAGQWALGRVYTWQDHGLRGFPGGLSIDVIDAPHRRWYAFLRALPDSESQKTYRHPELGVVAVDAALAQYACRGN